MMEPTSEQIKQPKPKYPEDRSIQRQIRRLIDANHTFQPYSLAGQTHIAQVQSVIDGDTIDVGMWLGRRIGHVRYRIRMLGINAPEMRPRRTVLHRDRIKRAAQAATDALSDQINRCPNCLVLLDCGEFDAFGRLLARIYKVRVSDPASNTWEKDADICQWMLDNNHAVPFVKK